MVKVSPFIFKNNSNNNSFPLEEALEALVLAMLFLTSFF